MLLTIYEKYKFSESIGIKFESNQSSVVYHNLNVYKSGNAERNRANSQ